MQIMLIWETSCQTNCTELQYIRWLLYVCGTAMRWIYCLHDTCIFIVVKIWTSLWLPAQDVPEINGIMTRKTSQVRESCKYFKKTSCGSRVGKIISFRTVKSSINNLYIAIFFAKLPSSLHYTVCYYEESVAWTIHSVHLTPAVMVKSSFRLWIECS